MQIVFLSLKRQF